MAKYPHWLAVQDGVLIEFSELAHLMAKAIHPSDDDLHDYGIARILLEEELPEAARKGELIVRNRVSMGAIPSGASLQNGVLLAHDLAPFLDGRGIEVRLIPYGSGPDLWSLENAAVSLAEQMQWTDASRGTLLDQMVEAANEAALVVRHPHTDLPINTGVVRPFYELVTPSDVNEWLASIGAPYKWEPSGSAKALRASPKTQHEMTGESRMGTVKEKWIAHARDLATKYIDAWRAAGFEPTTSDAALFVEGELFNRSVFNTRGQIIDQATIRREALTGITKRLPGEQRNNPKIPDGKRQRMPDVIGESPNR